MPPFLFARFVLAPARAAGGTVSVADETTAGGGFDAPPAPQPLVRNALTTNRFYASVLYRFRGRWQP